MKKINFLLLFTMAFFGLMFSILALIEQDFWGITALSLGTIGLLYSFILFIIYILKQKDSQMNVKLLIYHISFMVLFSGMFILGWMLKI